MKVVKLCIAFSFVITSFLVFYPTATNACSCASIVPVEESYNKSDAIFSGKVVKQKQVGGGYKFTFEVIKTWKGLVAEKRVIFTSMSTASCGYPFLQNQEYLVYAMESEGDLTTNICMRTKQLSEANEDITKLNDLSGNYADKDERDDDQEEEDGGEEKAALTTTSIFLIVGLLILALGYFIWKYRK